MKNIKTALQKRFSRIWDDPCKLFAIFGFVFTSIAGTLLHFLPDIAANNFVYLIAPTNESVWEHLKLLFYPALFFMIFEYFAYGKEASGFIGAKLRGILLGEAVIVAAHYIFSGIIGKDVSWIDITLFFVGAAIAYIVPYMMMKSERSKSFSARNAVAVFVLIIALFTIFTFMPPRLGIFIDPQTGSYGIT